MSSLGMGEPGVRGEVPWGDGGRNGFPASGGYVWQDREQGRPHRRVAQIALEVAGRHGFALAGRGALAACGLAGGPVEGVELATDGERGVRRAAGVVVSALRREGFTARENATLGELASRHRWVGDRLARWMVTGPGEGRVGLELAFATRSQGPIWVEGIGPVVHEEDAAGALIAALAAAGRGQPGEYADAAALLERYRLAALIGFARRLEAGLADEEIAAIGRRLDALPAQAFAGLGLTDQQVEAVRARFAPWPRETDAVPGGPAPQSRKGKRS